MKGREIKHILDESHQILFTTLGDIILVLKFVFVSFSRILPLDEFFYAAKSYQIFNFSLI